MLLRTAVRSRSKFRNVRTNGYDSKREANRAAELQILEKMGEIKDLRYQVPLELLPKQEGERAVVWRADFVYFEKPRTPNMAWPEIWEDTKGVRTREYVIKRKLALFRHGIRIRES